MALKRTIPRTLTCRGCGWPMEEEFARDGVRCDYCRRFVGGERMMRMLDGGRLKRWLVLIFGA